jgi:hypothetical protein
MAFQNIVRKENVMKLVSFILIILIPMMGFPFLTSAAPNPADSSRTADITKQKGRWLTIDKGWVHGVNKGMTGIIRFSYGSGGSAFYYSRGLFEVRKVYKRTARVYVTKIPGGTDLSKAVQVLFGGNLTPRDIKQYPSKKLISIKLPVEVTVERYINFQIIEYSGKGEQFRAVSSYAAAVEKRILMDIGKADYKLWTKGQSIINADSYKRKFNYGPLEFRRNLSNDKILFKTEGFKLTQEALNQAIRQVKKGHLEKGYWKKKIKLDLLGNFFPTDITFHFKAYPINYNTKQPTFIIKCISDLFYFKTLNENAVSTDVASGKFIGVIVYSPSDDCLYQETSIFESTLNDEYLKIEECSYLVDACGKKALRLLDLRKELNLAKKPLEVKDPTTLPMWAIQATMVQRAACLSGFTVAERGTNPSSQNQTPGELIVKVVTFLPINNRYVDKMGNELTNEYLDQGKDGDKERRKAESEVSLYNEVLPQASTAIFPSIEDLYFYDLIQQYQITSLAFSINEVFDNVVNPHVHIENLNRYGFLNSRLEFFETEPSYLKKLENSSVRSMKHANTTSVQTNNNSVNVSPGNTQTTQPIPEKTQEVVEKGAEEEKNIDKPQTEDKKPNTDTKGKSQKAVDTQDTGLSTANGVAAAAGNSSLGTIVLGTAVAAGAVYAGLELVKVLGEFDIIGLWTFTISIDWRYFGVGSTTKRMNLNSDGTVDWQAPEPEQYRIDRTSGNYTVNGREIRMELFVRLINTWKSSVVWDVYYTFTGEIHDKNNMSGQLTVISDYPNHDYSETYSGSWSAKR